MKKSQWLLIALVLILTFLLVYTPHYTDRFPKHIDEYHHITEAIKLKQGEYKSGMAGLEIGFHIFLMMLYIVFRSNLILIYKFLPAIFACLSSLALFFLIYKKSNNFLIALFSMMFFASIRSNVNVTGLWFFTPLTFSIPFIFLYIYFFTEGIEKQNKKFILISIAIMTLLIFTHAISVLFAIPFLIIYSLIHYKYLIKQYKFFSIFLIIPIIAFLFYKFIRAIPMKRVINDLIHSLQFRRGWGILELDISFLLLYSLIGFILAIFGIISIFIFMKKLQIKKYIIFILWPLSLLIFIFIFQKTRISYLVPYQRNLYYFILSIPILSAFGLYYLILIFQSLIKDIQVNSKTKEFIQFALILIISLLVFWYAFGSYAYTPKQIQPYRVIDNNDYEALLFLQQQEKGKVMAMPMTSVAIFPVSQQKPVGTIAFYGNREDAESFFKSTSCESKQELLEKHNIMYVFSKNPINCSYTSIYNKNNYIYKTK